MSGSFVVAGIGAYRATKVGREAYAAKLAEEASKFTLVKSELRNGINKILQFITYLLWPAGLLTIYTQLFTTGADWRDAVLRMVGALVPMVPEGLVLLTSIAFAVGVVRLGRRQCLVQELPAIEGLARVDVVCADKTGTLTENGMRRPRSPRWAGTTRTADRRRAGLTGRRRPETERQHGGHRRGLPRPARLDRHRHRAVQVGDQVERGAYGQHGNWVIGAPDVLLDPAHPRPPRPRRSARGACGCCCSAPPTAASTALARPDTSRPSRSSFSSSASGPTPATRWNTLPPNMSPSR